MNFRFGALLKIVLLFQVGLMSLRGQGGKSVQELFAALAQTPLESSELLSPTSLARTLDQVDGADPRDVSDALNAIFRSARSQNHDVRMASLLAIQHIAKRPDGAALAAPARTLLEVQLYDSDEDVSGLSGEILGTMKPKRGSSSVGALRRFVQSERGPTQSKIAAIDALMHLDGNSPQNAELVRRYFDDHKEPGVRSAILSSIGLAHSDHKVLGDIVMEALESDDSDVQTAAILAVLNSGEPMISTARPRLVALASNANLGRSVRALLSDLLGR